MIILILFYFLIFNIIWLITYIYRINQYKKGGYAVRFKFESYYDEYKVDDFLIAIAWVGTIPLYFIFLFYKTISNIIKKWHNI